MKTIKELRNEGTISTRTYNLLYRNVGGGIKEMTIEDLFRLIGKDKMMGWRQMGLKTMEELEGLL